MFSFLPLLIYFLLTHVLCSGVQSLQALFEERLRLLLSKKGSETGAAMQEDTRPPVSNGGTCGSGPSTQLMKEEM